MTFPETSDCPLCSGDVLENTDRVATDLSNLPHLTDLDVDLNMPTDQNFRYYSSHDFHSDHDIIECSSDAKSFSALHCNIRSLTANYDNMLTMLSDLNFSFSLIGLSETKIKSDKNNLLNISIPGNIIFLHNLVQLTQEVLVFMLKVV